MKEDVDGRDEPDHDGEEGVLELQAAAARSHRHEEGGDLFRHRPLTHFRYRDDAVGG